MQEQLLRYFESIRPLTIEEREAIAATIQIAEFKKETVLLAEGQIATSAYFVLKGCVRQFYLVDGEERISNFFTPDQWVTSVKSMREGSPSDHYLVCSTDATLVVGNPKKEEALFRQYPQLETVGRMVMEKVFSEQQEILSAYLKDTPEKRYMKLVRSRPDLVSMVPQYQIASYVGVKPESLSRIRRRMVTQERSK